MKFLIDECLSPDLVHMARGSGYTASTHVTWLGLSSRNDRDIAARAITEDFVLVTNNSKDFIRIYSGQPIHPGLVCLNAALRMMDRAIQGELFRLSLEALDHEPINEVVAVTLTQDRMIEVAVYDWPQPGPV